MKDKDISFIIGYILRWGVIIALGIAFLGGVLYLLRHGHEINKFQNAGFVEKNENIGQLINNTVSGVLKGRGYFICQLSILLLIATPLSRIIFSIFAFNAEGDKMYVAITFIVLLIIVISILSGFGG